MKTTVRIEESQDVTELLDILLKLRKLRQSIYTSQTEDFIVEVNSGKMPV